MEFKVGDKVVCINKSTTSFLDVGKIYTIKDLGVCSIVLFFEEYDKHGFNAKLFVSLESFRKKKIKKLKYLIKRNKK